MMVSVETQFDSRMAFKPFRPYPVDTGERKLFELFRWANQIGHGFGFEINLFWFFFTVGFTFHTKEQSDDS